MNDKVKEALETLSNLVFPTGSYDFVDGHIEVRLAGKEGAYLSSLLGKKQGAKLRAPKGV